MVHVRGDESEVREEPEEGSEGEQGSTTEEERAGGVRITFSEAEVTREPKEGALGAAVLRETHLKIGV